MLYKIILIVIVLYVIIAAVVYLTTKDPKKSILWICYLNTEIGEFDFTDSDDDTDYFDFD